mgnify:CR=1 FL=1
MRYKRTIKFQYFRIFCQKRGNDGNFGEKELYNLTEWISKAKGNHKKQFHLERIWLALTL